jgi:hypothetical protein
VYKLLKFVWAQSFKAFAIRDRASYNFIISQLNSSWRIRSPRKLFWQHVFCSFYIHKIVHAVLPSRPMLLFTKIIQLRRKCVSKYACRREPSHVLVLCIWQLCVYILVQVESIHAPGCIFTLPASLRGRLGRSHLSWAFFAQGFCFSGRCDVGSRICFPDWRGRRGGFILRWNSCGIFSRGVCA